LAEKTVLDKDFIVFCRTSQALFRQGFSRNNTLWVSYVLQTPTIKIYIGGDSGYDTHYADIGNKYGAIDLAILDNGQYDAAWKYIHHLPEEITESSTGPESQAGFSCSFFKFALANHPWDEPLVKAN
jgi:L-ascorbate metabolism protein UlaG (beta-lactamase superfamily)